MRILVCISILLSCGLFSSVQAQTTPYETDVEFRGSIATNGSSQDEFFEQRRTVLWGLALDASAKVQVGLSKTRVENQEILEIPLLFRYQVLENASIYGGVQAQLTRDLRQGSFPAMKQLQATMGIDYDITPTWDAGVQFVIPIQESQSDFKSNFELSQPIRLRTGIKF